jgi:serine/threonine protein kinase
MSPQITAAKVQGKALYDGTKADVWAMGVLLCVMLIGKFPFEGDSISTMGVNDPLKKVCRSDGQEWAQGLLTRSRHARATAG